MQRGCDPDALEAVAPCCAALVEQLRATRRRVAATDRLDWHGPAARRRRNELAALVPRLALAAGRVERMARLLADHGVAQRRASLAPPQHRVLRSDRAGDGRWIASTGAPDAPVAVVLVPGVGTSWADRRELDRDARRLWESLAVVAERDGAGQDHVRVVAWLGYDPPDHVVAGLRRGPAAAGGAALADHVHRWRRTGAERIVVVGHSYGALVAARASAAGAGVDELVMLGAPGLGVAGVDRLALADGADLWAAAAHRDPVSVLARTGRVHGPDPVPRARRLPTSSAGHGGYLDDPVLLASLASLALHDPRPAGTVARTQTRRPVVGRPRGTPWASP